MDVFIRNLRDVRLRQTRANVHMDDQIVGCDFVDLRFSSSETQPVDAPDEQRDADTDERDEPHEVVDESVEGG